jgi:hypothetical protein
MRSESREIPGRGGCGSTARFGLQRGPGGERGERLLLKGQHHPQSCLCRQGQSSSRSPPTPSVRFGRHGNREWANRSDGEAAHMQVGQTRGTVRMMTNHSQWSRLRASWRSGTMRVCATRTRLTIVTYLHVVYLSLPWHRQAFVGILRAVVSVQASGSSRPRGCLHAIFACAN